MSSDGVGKFQRSQSLCTKCKREAFARLDNSMGQRIGCNCQNVGRIGKDGLFPRLQWKRFGGSWIILESRQIGNDGPIAALIIGVGDPIVWKVWHADVETNVRRVANGNRVGKVARLIWRLLIDGRWCCKTFAIPNLTIGRSAPVQALCSTIILTIPSIRATVIVLTSCAILESTLSILGDWERRVWQQRNPRWRWRGTGRNGGSCRNACGGCERIGKTLSVTRLTIFTTPSSTSVTSIVLTVARWTATVIICTAITYSCSTATTLGTNPCLNGQRQVWTNRGCWCPIGTANLYVWFNEALAIAELTWLNAFGR